MYKFYLLFILLFKSIDGFYLQDDSEDYIPEQEPCNTRCKNGGQCFLSSFCICPKGFSGRYCEVSLNEQCGTFSSMTTIEIDCVLCICYNGLFMCDIQPLGLCRTSNLFLTRSMRINRVLKIIQYRFKNIHSFEPTIKENITLDDNDRQLINLTGYRIILNHSSFKFSSIILILFCLLSIYLFK